eukprot:CAMPEP_0183310950 /NCGR_PEP_ID=MMETSP0160_2-20130417/34317_1 /TAXON_ID=2839 ORGANISM="Odontella Sinensis, Strain Grunow 1884" /NCGR_SAMPLE_ID=MMETSP0160_2 /ASSEMBLY_ACC=CAM_ASM_000250 /LENGTH=61 /DNA_ID=CAMNT_0025475379 /DNA_START=1 /DNA_END=183 /DNA_ORIENTATION=-
MTGHAAVAGEGAEGARTAGEVAAHNMAREYHEKRRGGRRWTADNGEMDLDAPPRVFLRDVP